VTHNIFWAAQQALDGEKVRRTHWKHKHLGVVQSNEMTRPYFYLCDHGETAPWAPTFSEIMATDWELDDNKQKDGCS
jgi:Protein of unknown function (DUF2829)